MFCILPLFSCFSCGFSSAWFFTNQNFETRETPRQASSAPPAAPPLLQMPRHHRLRCPEATLNLRPHDSRSIDLSIHRSQFHIQKIFNTFPSNLLIHISRHFSRASRTQLLPLALQTAPPLYTRSRKSPPSDADVPPLLIRAVSFHRRPPTTLHWANSPCILHS